MAGVGHHRQHEAQQAARVVVARLVRVVKAVAATGARAPPACVERTRCIGGSTDCPCACASGAVRTAGSGWIVIASRADAAARRASSRVVAITANTGWPR